jgi:hypothetical protein
VDLAPEALRPLFRTCAGSCVGAVFDSNAKGICAQLRAASTRSGGGKLKLSGEEENTIEAAKVEDWDTSLLCRVLLYGHLNDRSLKSKLSHIQLKSVTQIQTSRNKCYGHLSSKKITRALYQDHFPNVFDALIALGINKGTLDKVCQEAQSPHEVQSNLRSLIENTRIDSRTEHKLDMILEHQNDTQLSNRLKALKCIHVQLRPAGRSVTTSFFEDGDLQEAIKPKDLTKSLTDVCSFPSALHTSDYECLLMSSISSKLQRSQLIAWPCFQRELYCTHLEMLFTRRFVGVTNNLIDRDLLCPRPISMDFEQETLDKAMVSDRSAV